MLKKYLGKLGWILFGFVLIGFWYSGFADYGNYASRGFRIFYLPLAGVILAMLLYAVVFHVGWQFMDFIDWPPLIVFPICIPSMLPVILMVWIRERNPNVVGAVVLGFGAVLFVLFFVGVILELQEGWPAWAKIGLVLALMVIGYVIIELMPTDPFGASSILSKYEPLRFLRR
jgi:hypothetical protein